MNKFHKILVISRGMDYERATLEQALALTYANHAQLTILIIHPKLPENFGEYKELYENSLMDSVKKSLETVKTGLRLPSTQIPPQINIEIESDSTPAIHVIQRILRGQYDLLIKQAEPQAEGKGFKSIDMELLRKCPCPIWLCRSFKNGKGNVRLAVAVDPKTVEPAGYDLSIKLLEISDSLSTWLKGESNIISCWDYELEDYLRQNAFIPIQDEELTQEVLKEKNMHCTALSQLIKQSKIRQRQHVHYLRGKPDLIIPAFIKENNIDILVMGTVARTGIPGFITGNTAENIIQDIDCSLLALKPNGFISPVNAY